MPYDNNSKKFVIVLNRKSALPVRMNAVAHVALGIGGKVDGQQRLLDYPNDATGFQAKISEYPFIILDAKSSEQLANLLKNAMAHADVAYNVFTTSMIGASAEGQQLSTRCSTESELDYVAVGLFGERERIDPLTKKFSLFKDPSNV